MSIAVVRYNAGNVFSVQSALRRIGVEADVTDNPDILLSADKVILPGVGEARAAMEYLTAVGLDSVIKNITKPLLGICIGQQLLCRHSQEGDVDCLGIFDNDVLRFCPDAIEDKVPHTGWNTLEVVNPDGLMIGGLDKRWVYYVHSYYVPVGESTSAVTDYIVPFSAAMHKDNYYSTQFHPEKSGDVGEIVLRNFLAL